MAIWIKDEFLEQQVERVQQQREDATLTKTARDLIRERLSAMGAIDGPETSPASIPAGGPSHVQTTTNGQAGHVPDGADSDTRASDLTD